jgi:serine/threonine-protein kinase
MEIVNTRSAAPVVAGLREHKVREQLERILGSKTFRAVERLRRFATFVVLETLEGRGDQLKEFVVGIQVFDKDPSFDPRNDPIVRVQARRLRSRLARYYAEEGQSDEIVIDLPKGGYATEFRLSSRPSGKRSAASSPLSRNTIQVSAFADHSPEGELDFFCQGLREEIIDALTRVKAARVVSGVEAGLLVSGGVRKVGDDVRITAQIIDGANGSYLWSESVNGNLRDAIALQEQVAAKVQAHIEARRVESLDARRLTGNIGAYNLYLQGRYQLSQRTEEGLRKAADFFDRAISEDPQFAEAYSGLADAYGLLGHYGVLTPAEVWTKTTSNAAWAVSHDDRSAEAHTSLAHVKATQDWDWSGAESEFRRAIQLDPRYPTAHHWYAVSCLAPMGRLDEALEEIETARALDPVSSIIARDLAVVYYYRRDFEAALEQCDNTIALNPHFAPAYWTLGLIQEQMGDFDESGAAFQRAFQLAPHSPRTRAAHGRILALSGKREEALAALKELYSLSEIRYVSPFEVASLHFALEQWDQGFEWLKKAFQDRCFELVSLNVDPRFDPIKGDARFAALANQLNLNGDTAK